MVLIGQLLLSCVPWRICLGSWIFPHSGTSSVTVHCSLIHELSNTCQHVHRDFIVAPFALLPSAVYISCYILHNVSCYILKGWNLKCDKVPNSEFRQNCKGHGCYSMCNTYAKCVTLYRRNLKVDVIIEFEISLKKYFCKLDINFICESTLI